MADPILTRKSAESLAFTRGTAVCFWIGVFLHVQIGAFTSDCDDPGFSDTGGG